MIAVRDVPMVERARNIGKVVTKTDRALGGAGSINSIQVSVGAEPAVRAHSINRDLISQKNILSPPETMMEMEYEDEEE